MQHVTMTPPTCLKADPTLRATLLDYYLQCATGQALSAWLHDLGQDPKGTIEEKRARVRASTKYLSMPAEQFPDQTISYLSVYESDHLSDMCEALSIDDSGGKDLKWRRIMREVAVREGWLPRIDAVSQETLTLEKVLPFIDWHLIPRRGKYEQDFYDGFLDEMEEVFGHDYVHEQLPIAFGSTLKIDFHIGHPQREGVGIEFKMPDNNSDLQRALGQMDQYKTRYGAQLLLVLFPDWLQKSHVTLFLDQLREKNIAAITKWPVCTGPQMPEAHQKLLPGNLS